jgi:hypothetical protein
VKNRLGDLVRRSGRTEVELVSILAGMSRCRWLCEEDEDEGSCASSQCVRLRLCPSVMKQR